MLVRTAQRTMAVLRALNDPGLLKISDISRLAGIPRSTTKRVLDTLEFEGYVKRNRARGFYWLTDKSCSLSKGYLVRDILRDSAERNFASVDPSFKWLFSLSRIRSFELEVLATSARGNPFSLKVLDIGSLVSMAESASGCVILANVDLEYRTAYFNKLEKTSSFKGDLGRLVNTVEIARRDGFSIHQCPGERDKSLAVPIFRHGKVFGALSLDFMISVVSDRDAEANLLPTLEYLAKTISSEI